VTDSPEAVGPDLPRLHLVTDDSILRRAGFVREVESILGTGGSRVALHLRGRTITGAQLWHLADRCAAIALRSAAILVINDRLDVALACDAAGVQLGAASFPVATARRILRPGTLIGASVHGLAEAKHAVRDGADFLVAGTVYETPSHPDRPGAGPPLIETLGGLGVPIVAIGGITPERVRTMLAAGAYGVAVIRGVWDADRPLAAAERYLAELE
jgi:thiamine-phosphate diphosphorylase